MSSSNLIQITVNGQSVETTDRIPLPAFLETQEIDLDRVVVEWNGQAQTRVEASEILLAQDDVLEVVRIVAGG